MNYLIIIPWWIFDSLVGLFACQAIGVVLLLWLYGRYAMGMYDKIEAAIAQEKAEAEQEGLHLVHLDIDKG